MLTYAVVAAKPGRSIPPTMLDLLGRPAPAEVPFDPSDHLFWTDTRGRVAFGGWQDVADLAGFGSHWSVDDEGLTAFSGIPRVRGEGSPAIGWAEHLARTVAGRDARAVSEAVAGIFSIVSIDREGAGFVVADPLGICVLHRAEDDDVVVVSPRASLAARLVTPPGQEPRRDVAAVVSTVYAGFVADEGTGFEAVRALPNACAFEVGHGPAPTVRRWDQRPWLPADCAPGDMDLTDAVAASLREVGEAVRWVADRDDQVRVMELTGGKDSRTVFAAALAAGVTDRFHYVTWGPPHLPDQQVVAELVERYGLAHGTRAPVSAAGLARRRVVGPVAERPPSIPTRILHHVWLTSGGESVWDRRPLLGMLNAQTWMSGGLGEGLRTNYKKLVGLGSMEELEDLVRGDAYRSDAFGLLIPEARRHFDDMTVAALEEARPPGGSPQDAIDGDYLARRMRRWLGSMLEVELRNRVFPLYSMTTVRAAFGIGPDLRTAEALPFGMIRSVDPDLALHRLAEDSWPEAAWTGLPDASEYRRLHPPIPVQRPRGAAAKERMRRRLIPPRRTGVDPVSSVVRTARRSEIDEARPLLRLLVDLPASHPLFDWLDRSAVQRAVDQVEVLRVPELKSVYAAMTAAIWLEGADERYRPG